ncbi:MAG: hypothetical protein IT438_01585 [Phycisphaerales bacterium]|nr:hypothetical protein [Phycisphaerales bacterium]
MTTLRRLNAAAFTVIELLVVIVILAVVTLIALPSFTAMIYNQEKSLAENLLRVGMKTGRDAALRTQGDDDAALVFTYGSNNRLGMVACVKAGVLPASTNQPQREVFVPAADMEPLQLPAGWVIRGYAPPGTLGAGTGWYDDGNGQQNRYDDAIANWVFPETDFYNVALSTTGVDRQTFMVRFKARTGEMVTSPSVPVLVVMPRPTYQDRQGLPAGSCQANRIDISPDLMASVRCILTSNDFSNIDRARLLGDDSSDVVLAAPVAQFAVYDESKLASALGVELDRKTRSIYQPVDGSTVRGPTYVRRVIVANINKWIIGDTNFDGEVRGSNDGDAPAARLFMIDRYSGVPRGLEVQP